MALHLIHVAINPPGAVMEDHKMQPLQSSMIGSLYTVMSSAHISHFDSVDFFSRVVPPSLTAKKLRCEEHPSLSVHVCAFKKHAGIAPAHCPGMISIFGQSNTKYKQLKQELLHSDGEFHLDLKVTEGLTSVVFPDFISVSHSYLYFLFSPNSQ